MYLLDTNILASEILKKYEQDQKTLLYRHFLNSISLEKRIVSDFILGEFETFMLRVVPKRYKMAETEKNDLIAVTHAHLAKLIELCTMENTTNSIVTQALSIYQKYAHIHYINFTDSLFLSCAQANGYTILSQDQRLTARAKELKIKFWQPES